jgi:oligogalacturonide transporter
MFFPFGSQSLAVRFFSALFSYMLFCAVHSSVMIPYYSLASEITDDYTERARMTSLRLGFSIAASIICVALPELIVGQFEGNAGYIAMSLTFGSVFMVCVGITGFFSKEGIPAPEAVEPFV